VKKLLVVAGSDSSGGAGIQADLKTCCAFGVYGMTAITAVTVQNTMGVSGFQAIDPDTVYGQIEACLTDIGADAIKTGMLVNRAVIEAVAAALEKYASGLPLVLDPVMVATSGDALIDDAAVETMVERLFPLASVVTPNRPEAERLTGIAGDATAAGRRLLAMGAKAALVKGGHGAASAPDREGGGAIEDLLFWADKAARFSHARIDTRNTHGTGCTLASAIACGLAEGQNLTYAVRRAGDYIQRAIETAPGFGTGHGPLNHLIKL
jgi:hydroxymethylpyrimidine/phosphomethylpyrimidine kinase